MPRPFAAPTTARRLFCLALTIAPLACASAKAQQPSGDQDAAARFAALESRYVALLDRCAAELAAEGKQASAQLVRRLSVPEIPGRTAAVLPPEDAPDLADPIDPRVVGDKLRYMLEHAECEGAICTADCAVTGRVFMVKGGDIRWWSPWIRQDFLAEPTEWTIAEIAEAMQDLPPMPVSP